MKRVAVLMLVSMAGLTLGACEKQGDNSVGPPSPTVDVGPITADPIKANVNSATINGVGPSHLNAGDPTILEDQRSFYTKHEIPAAPATPATPAATAPAETNPAPQPK